MKLPKRALVASILCMAVLDGCGADKTAGPTTEETARSKPDLEAEVGSVDLRLTFPDGTRLETLSYRIDNLFLGTVAQDQIEVGDETSVAFQVGNLTAFPFYTLALNGTTSAGVPCSAPSQEFEVLAGGTTVLRTTLFCGEGEVLPSTGNARVEIDIEQRLSCPYVAGIAAHPLRAELGDAISVQGYATLASASFAWSVSPASAGSFTPAGSASTSFVCAEAGNHELTLTVSGEAGCPERVDRVAVTCLAGEVEPPPVPSIAGSYAVRTSVYTKVRDGSAVSATKTLGYSRVDITSAPDGSLQLTERGCWTQSLPRPGDATQAYAWSKPAWVQAIPPVTRTLIANDDGTFTRPAQAAHLGWDPTRQPLACSASATPLAPWPSGWGSTCTCNASAAELPPYDSNTAPYDCRLVDADGDGFPGVSSIAATSAPSSPDANAPALGGTAYAAIDTFDSWLIVAAADGRHTATISDQSTASVVGCSGLACSFLPAAQPPARNCPQALNRAQFVPTTESSDSCAEIIVARNTLFTADQDGPWPDDSACPPP